MCKRISKFELQLSSYWKNIKFSRYCPKFHIFTKIVIFQVYLQLFRPTTSSLSILWQGHIRNTVFHFCQLWAVNVTHVTTYDNNMPKQHWQLFNREKLYLHAMIKQKAHYLHVNKVDIGMFSLVWFTSLFATMVWYHYLCNFCLHLDVR